MYRDIDHELSEQTSALESLLNELDDEMAMEGLFSKPKSVDQMLAKVKKNISKKCKTVEDCDDMLANLKNEEEKFNSALSTMKDAAVQFKNGEIDKKELKNIIKPAAKDLKKTCNIISLKDINEDTTNVTDEEIQKLHDFLVGTRDAINERKNELSGEETAEEGCWSKSSCESFVGGYLDDDIAMEADIALEGLKDAMTTLRNWVIKFCDNMYEKCVKKSKECTLNDKRSLGETYAKFAKKFKAISEKCKTANSEAELKKQRDEAQKNADVLKEMVKKDEEMLNKVKKGVSRQAMGNSGMHKKPASESFDIEDDPYGIMMEYAYEAYLEAKENYRTVIACQDTCIDDDIATEATVASVTFSAVLALAAFVDSNSRQAWRMKNSEAKKAIDKSIKEAKAAVEAGETDKAINLYKNAIKGYQGILAAVKKIPKISNADVGLSKYHVKDNLNSAGKTAAIRYLEEKIDSCKDAILKIENNKEKNASSENQASESYVDDALFSLDMAIEGLTSNIEDDEDPLEGLDDALESFEQDDCDFSLEPATEAAEEAIAAGVMVAAYAALIAIYAKVCSGSSAGKEAKYIKMLNKELKPKLKEAKHTIKVGKSKHDYDMAISGCNQVIAIDEKIKKSVEELGREIKVSETKNSDGSSSEKIKKAFGVKAAATINKADDEIDAMKAQIKIFEMKKKQKSGVDDAVTEAYIAGYTRALEAMEDDDDSLEGLENASESFLKELL